MVRIVQISDTHLGPSDDLAPLIDAVNAVRPRLVVHTGDIVDSPDDADARTRARLVLDGIRAPLVTVPGNHDVGEPPDSPRAERLVTEARIAAFESTWGPDYWRRDLDGATVLGIDSELFGSGLGREEVQWTWLEETVAEMGRGRPVLVFLHKPVWAPFDEPSPHPVDIGESRTRLLDLFGRIALVAVGSGHLHCYRKIRRGDAIEVWAPSTACLSDAADDRPGPLHQLGIVEYTLHGFDVDARYLTVPGLR